MKEQIINKIVISKITVKIKTTTNILKTILSHKQLIITIIIIQSTIKWIIQSTIQFIAKRKIITKINILNLLKKKLLSHSEEHSNSIIMLKHIITSSKFQMIERIHWKIARIYINTMIMLLHRTVTPNKINLTIIIKVKKVANSKNKHKHISMTLIIVAEDNNNRIINGFHLKMIKVILQEVE